MSSSNYGNQLLFLLFILFSVGADTLIQAQTRAVYLSVNGSDSNSCARAAPCRQMPRALNVVAGGGTVVILDGGEYENFTVSKSVSIVSEKGVNAFIVPGAGYAGVSVSAATAVSVRLRGLTIVGNDSGIEITSPIYSLSVEDCIIQAPLYGIRAAGAGKYSVKNTRVSDALYGVYFATSTGQIAATIDDSRVENIQTVGIWALNNARVIAKNTVVTNSSPGFSASHSTARMIIENCLSVNNTGDGVSVESGWIRVSDSNISNNDGYGIRNTGGSVKTFGNNRLSFNKLGETSGTISVLAQQ